MQHVPVIPDGFGFCVEERLRAGWSGSCALDRLPG